MWVVFPCPFQKVWTTARIERSRNLLTYCMCQGQLVGTLGILSSSLSLVTYVWFVLMLVPLTAISQVPLSPTNLDRSVKPQRGLGSFFKISRCAPYSWEKGVTFKLTVIPVRTLGPTPSSHSSNPSATIAGLPESKSLSENGAFATFSSLRLV